MTVLTVVLKDLQLFRTKIKWKTELNKQKLNYLLKDVNENEELDYFCKEIDKDVELDHLLQNHMSKV